MKRITVVALVLVMVLALSGIASADPPVDATFKIVNGTYTHYELSSQPLPNGQWSYYDTAEGGVTGYPGWDHFTYEEWGTVAFDSNPPDPNNPVPLNGKNHGVITIWSSDSQKLAVLDFDGKTSSYCVTGKFNVIQQEATKGTGAKLGHGDYSSTSSDCSFDVTFTGKFR